MHKHNKLGKIIGGQGSYYHSSPLERGPEKRVSSLTPKIKNIWQEY